MQRNRQSYWWWRGPLEMGGMTVRGFRDQFMWEGVGTEIGLGWVELGTWPETGSLEPRQTTSAEPRLGNWRRWLQLLASQGPRPSASWVTVPWFIILGSFGCCSFITVACLFLCCSKVSTAMPRQRLGFFTLRKLRKPVCECPLIFKEMSGCIRIQLTVVQKSRVAKVPHPGPFIEWLIVGHRGRRFTKT